MEERDITYLEVIAQAIAALKGYIENETEAGFLSNDVLKHACLMRLVVIGEFGGKISAELKNRFTEIEC